MASVLAVQMKLPSSPLVLPPLYVGAAEGYATVMVDGTRGDSYVSIQFGDQASWYILLDRAMLQAAIN